MLLLRFVDLVGNSVLCLAGTIADGRCRLFCLICGGLTSLFCAISRSMCAFAHFILEGFRCVADLVGTLLQTFFYVFSCLFDLLFEIHDDLLALKSTCSLLASAKAASAKEPSQIAGLPCTLFLSP